MFGMGCEKNTKQSYFMGETRANFARLPLHPRLAHMVLRAEDSKAFRRSLGCWPGMATPAGPLVVTGLYMDYTWIITGSTMLHMDYTWIITGYTWIMNGL